MSNYFLYICKNKFLLIKTEAAMGYNSQSNIMKKLLLLGIITLTALFTACEKDKPEDKSTNGIDISTLDINDPNTYYWKYSLEFNCNEGEERKGVYTTCFVGTTEEIIYWKNITEEMVKQEGRCIYKITIISKITEDECISLGS